MSRVQRSARRSAESSDSLAFASSTTASAGKAPRTARLGGASDPVQRKAQPDAAAQDNQDVAGQISIQDIQYEFVAHGLAYQDEIPDAAHEVLRGWGYQTRWASKINDAATGLFVGLLMPDPSHPELMPILAFRGTEPTNGIGDILSDVHPVAVGYNQFHDNEPIIAQMVAEAGGRVDVTGHSLGGALAQHAAAAFGGAVNRVVTFQAPGIEAGAARQFADQQNAPSVTHHIAAGDLVDNAGQQHLAGEHYKHDVGGGPASHVRYLFSTPEFAEQRAQLGLTDEVLASMGIAQQETQSPIERSDSHPEKIMNAVSEPVRGTVGAALYPIVNGLAVLFRNDDAALREQVAGMNDAQLAGYPASERAYIVDRLCRGITGSKDENTILRVLRASASAGDAVTVLDVVGGYRLAKNMHGGQYQELRDFYRSHYYAQTGQDKALSMLRSCIDGMTAEWEEQMIADVLVDRADGRALITQIGGLYGGGGFSDGLSEIQWQLDGDDQRRVDAMYA